MGDLDHREEDTWITARCERFATSMLRNKLCGPVGRICIHMVCGVLALRVKCCNELPAAGEENID